ncbi:MAG: VacJ family lipoprotein [Desulfobacterales bacterium]|nr:VacJ family lipoprotein [Desulfobacterales bacterium]MCP4158996.1 VacJ family lipoprotein [Deltaproteobacteria bacterium]
MKEKIKLLLVILALATFFSACGSKIIDTENIDGNISIEKEENVSGEEKIKSYKEVKDTLDDSDIDEDEELSDEELEEDFEDDEEVINGSDPLYYFNVGMYHVTDKTYFWVLKPIATGYKFIVPDLIRIWVRNFFYNLGMPVRFVSNLLQFKFKDATAEIGRFLLNSTVGILGFGNPAENFPFLNPTKEDLGQAFGKWGIGEGFFVYLPFLGPSTLRDTVGLVGDEFLNPINYIESDIAKYSITGFKMINNVSLQLGTYEAIKEAALDPYEAIRNGYLQRRRKEVAD